MTRVRWANNRPAFAFSKAERSPPHGARAHIPSGSRMLIEALRNGRARDTRNSLMRPLPCVRASVCVCALSLNTPARAWKSPKNNRKCAGGLVVAPGLWLSYTPYRFEKKVPRLPRADAIFVSMLSALSAAGTTTSRWCSHMRLHAMGSVFIE